MRVKETVERECCAGGWEDAWEKVNLKGDER
jgi:hypothetical protein